MFDCKVMISTKADGVRSEILREGNMETFPRAVNLVYREENATVRMSVHGDRAEMQREGDYTLSLLLENGKKTMGSIGIGGNVGEISVETHAIEYRIAEKFVVLRLKYDLLMGTERQCMDIRILATKNGKK